MERLIVNRLAWWLDENQLLSNFQAGFRRGRSTVDQCLRLSQSIFDGFQKRPSERTLLTLFDYSKAYDTVWRTGLLTKMYDMGIPRRFISWVKAWLTNRLAGVRFGTTTSKARVFKEGLPQGSVLSPLLFLIFTNDLLTSFEPTTLVSAFADDLAVACTGVNKNELAEMSQWEINKVEAWSRRWRLTLNPTKCETALFTYDASERSWSPRLQLGGLEIRHSQSPVFLGIRYDPQLTFTPHVANLSQKMLARTNILRRVSGTSWGWHRSTLRSVYIATQRCVAEYAAPAWAPFTSRTNLEKSERAQHQAARAITHQTRSTPVEALNMEADLPPLECRLRFESARYLHKCLLLADGDPRRVLAEKEVKIRLRRTDWRTSATHQLETALTTSGPRKRNPPPEPPWDLPPPATVLFTAVSKTAPEEEQKGRAEQLRKQLGRLDVEIYTDGSTKEGTRDGGAGVVVLREGEEVWRT